ncbi:MAG: coproporphyrinogen III oxidase family protein, partial [Planctomycetes bacterium]|nr:coproporphyrinogen III oxidase family protein [Planctomycetota bacterium]
SNYPPFSFWSTESNAAAHDALERAPDSALPLGLYLHIPFCRKRCKFCYFRVYTDKNSKDVEAYLAALTREVELYSRLPVMNRPFRFAYFGGGTPSFLSAKQLLSLVDRLREHVSWDDADEVTFECEPGTLTTGKLAAIRDLGVTRLSLGVENFNDRVLEENGRAHRSPEVFRTYDWARDVGFRQINIDLIAGMVGETHENWRDCIAKTIELAPESVTIYQMELPYNAVYAQGLQDRQIAVANWATKRRWVAEAFAELAAAGYQTSSAYTMVKDSSVRFVYRDALWHGADMIGTGVASFSHVGGVHFQNLDGFDRYVERLDAGELPLGRALKVTPRQLMIRELILQLKLGRIEADYFKTKYAIDVREEFRTVLADLQSSGMLEERDESLRLTEAGLLRVDSLLPAFFEPQHQGARYT